MRRMHDDPAAATAMGDEAAAGYVQRVHNPRDHVDELVDIYAASRVRPARGEPPARRRRSAAVAASGRG